MTVMEPRVAERRKNVSEDRARGRLKWILAVIVVAVMVAGSLWLIRSPILSVRQVEVSGAQNSDPSAAVLSLGMGIGSATIDIDATAITLLILKDPWVESVDVEILWPGSIVIDVTERTPMAPVLADGQWAVVATDGGVIRMISGLDVGVARVAIDQGGIVPGQIVTDPLVTGALTFLSHLSESTRTGVIVRVDGVGLVADVDGHVVRLGRPTEMAAKASVLEALLASGIEEGASIDLIAPLRPAVTNPQPEVEGEE